VYQGPDNTGNWAASTDNFCAKDGCYVVSVTSNGYDSDYDWEFGDASGNTGVTVNNINIGTGCISGCLDSLAENYNPDVDISVADSCEYLVVAGCTDSLACNYDSLAVQDNGTCFFAEVDRNCDGSCVDTTAVTVVVEQNSPYWGDGTYGATYSLSNSLSGIIVAEGPLDASYTWEESDDTWGCIPAGCYEFAVDGNGSNYGTDRYNWIVSGQTFGMNQSGLVSIGDTECVLGCVDPDALNYNPDANGSEEGTCEYRSSISW
jgi:hypothetical protein